MNSFLQGHFELKKSYFFCKTYFHTTIYIYSILVQISFGNPSHSKVDKLIKKLGEEIGWMKKTTSRGPKLQYHRHS
jgi:hypothetical protein